MRRRLIIGGVALIVVGIVIYLVILGIGANSGVTKSVVKQGEVVTPTQTSQPSPSATPSPQDFYNQISQIHTLPDGSGRLGDFGIVNTKQPLPGWFIVTISESGGQDYAEVILQQTGIAGNPLVVVAGPAQSFPADQYQLPDTVRNAL